MNRKQSRPSDKSSASVIRGLAPFLNIGVQLVVSTLLVGAVGWGIDEWVGTSPVGFVVGLLLGAAAGLYSVIRTILRNS